ncbi:hypothetical protein ACS2JQ_20455 [Bacillus cereus group sp. BceL101]|uniref:hypothetical protein n=10 Tax=Bacillus TaxID=1386 RepID=UPI0022E7D470|nr:hypothetical protein [Bacillus cereus]MDF9635156.1 hypothetical protein [Bacillus cereus]MDG1583620.1 hypothetical protein [Bacillus cereus]MDZ4503314.1 hypothetical protein [Bacillus cereus]WKT32992.1 hypothetical protein QPK55_09325 [Bacillus cereus]HDR4442748.1 hypothetical protein [Bacillus cereus]
MSMLITMDATLIDEFRDKVNDSKVLQGMLRNVDEKNHWNILCSAMDWISTVANGLPTLDIIPSDGMGYDHLDTLKLMQYIVLIDVLSESIIQLFRVMDKDQPYPLKSDTSVFQQSRLDDDTYFKHIRAAFSTHPVNLSSVDGVRNNGGERFYASWVAKHGPVDHDYYVLLYSNDPAKEGHYYLGVNIADLNLYAEKRYKLLEILIQMVDSKVKNHISFYQSKIISSKDEISEELDILLEEDKKRFGTFRGYLGYSNDILYIRRMLETDTNPISGRVCEQIIHDYKEFLKSTISQIREGVQNVNRINVLSIRCIGYEFEKIYTYLSNHSHPVGEMFFNELIKNLELPTFLSTTEDFDLKQLVVDSYIHQKSMELERNVNFDEFIICS